MSTVEEAVKFSHASEFVVLSHGFADYMRDYEILAAEYAGIEQTHDRVYQFIGCVSANTVMQIDFSTYSRSLPSSHPAGYSNVQNSDSDVAFSWVERFSTSQNGIDLFVDDDVEQWQKRLGIKMYKASIVTEAFKLQLIFHDLSTKLYPAKHLRSRSEPLVSLG